ncbi:hypothetical protein M0802_003389 [Mischocyttarus mexicanus]|nr:hypothetical protein M0802_003389 [Mischocyttarus mexicanus]
MEHLVRPACCESNEQLPTSTSMSSSLLPLSLPPPIPPQPLQPSPPPPPLTILLPTPLLLILPQSSFETTRSVFIKWYLFLDLTPDVTSSVTLAWSTNKLINDTRSPI